MYFPVGDTSGICCKIELHYEFLKSLLYFACIESYTANGTIQDVTTTDTLNIKGKDSGYQNQPWSVTLNILSQKVQVLVAQLCPALCNPTDYTAC